MIVDYGQNISLEVGKMILHDQQQMQQQAAQKEMELAEREMALKEFSAESKAAYDNRKLDIDESKVIVDDMSFNDEMRLRQEQMNNKINQSNA